MIARALAVMVGCALFGFLVARSSAHLQRRFVWKCGGHVYQEFTFPARSSITSYSISNGPQYRLPAGGVLSVPLYPTVLVSNVVETFPPGAIPR